MFEKRRGKRWTFQDRTTGTLRQLDYILVRRKWRNSILNSEAYNTFCSVGSDHRVVSAKIRLSLRTTKNPKRNLYDWEMFSRRPDLQEQYSVLIKNKFRPLQSDSLTEEYEKFIQVNNEAKKKFVPLKARTKKALHSQHQEIEMKRKVLLRTKEAFNLSPSQDSNEDMKKAQDDLKKAYTKIKEEEILKLARRVEDQYVDKRYGAAWSVINEITGRKKT